MRSFKKSHRLRSMQFSLSLLLVGTSISLLFTNCARSSFQAFQSAGDPFLEYAWHLRNTGQKVFAAEAGVEGIDLNLVETWGSDISGRGIKILISDDGVEDSHEDLRDNFLTAAVSKDYSKTAPYLVTTAPPKGNEDNHGTAVAGLVAAVGGNGVGSKGVAFNASIASASFLSSGSVASEAPLIDQASGDFDIFNMSWGSSQNNLTAPVTSFLAQLKAGVTNGRGGKGSLYIKAAGNDFFVGCHNDEALKCVGSSNFDSDNITPYTILVAALDSQGYAASYSSIGSNIWISSFGGEEGEVAPAMVTTDRSTCSKGYSSSSVEGDLAFEKGQEGNDFCKYTVTFNGTSSAAPVMTGVVALMLQANPALTWRDVKYILAKTAVPIFYNTTDTMSHPISSEAAAMPPGAVWDRRWVLNSAGFKFHNWYGFGRADVDAAVAMAKDYTSELGDFVETAFTTNTRSPALAIPDFDAGGASDTMVVATDLKIESVQLKISATHADISQLALELTSPSGTKSYLVLMNNSLKGITNFISDIFLTNAFYREPSAGTWTLKVIDGKSGTAGTLTNWSLQFTGSN